MRLPGLVLRVTLESLQTEETKNTVLEEINTAVTGGATMIILEAGGDGGFGSAKLYDAGCMLKTMLRGRAELLVAERVDIAAASGADGVLLSDEGAFPSSSEFVVSSFCLECALFGLVEGYDFSFQKLDSFSCAVVCSMMVFSSASEFVVSSYL